MKRTAIAFTLLFLIVGLLGPISETTRTKKKTSTSAGKKVAIPCPDSLNNIEDCLDTDTDNHIVLVDRVLRKKPNEAAKDTLSRSATIFLL